MAASRLRANLLALSLVGAAAGACLHGRSAPQASVPPPPQAELAARWSEAARRNDRLHGSVRASTPQGGLDLEVWLERPARWRLEGRDFFGQPVVTLVSDGLSACVWTMNDEQARPITVTRRALVDALAGMLPLEVPPAEVQDLLVGGIPSVFTQMPGTRIETSRGSDGGYATTVTAVDRRLRVAWAPDGRSARTLEVADADGSGALLMQVEDTESGPDAAWPVARRWSWRLPGVDDAMLGWRWRRIERPDTLDSQLFDVTSMGCPSTSDGR